MSDDEVIPVEVEGEDDGEGEVVEDREVVGVVRDVYKKVDEVAVVPSSSPEVGEVKGSPEDVAGLESALFSGGESATNVDVLRATITAPKDGSVDTLLMVSNVRVPTAVAVLFAKADWCDKKRAGRGAARRSIGKYLLEGEIGRRGEDNRANRVIAATEMGLRAEFEVRKSGGVGGALLGQ